MEVTNIPLAAPVFSLDQFESVIEKKPNDEHVFISEGHIVSSSSIDAAQNNQKTKTAFKEALLAKYPDQEDFVNQLLDVTSSEPMSAVEIKNIKHEVEQKNMEEVRPDPVAQVQGVEGTSASAEPAPTRVFGVPITAEQLKRITATAALAQGSIGLLKGGVCLAALGTTGALLAVPLGILVINHFASDSNTASAALPAAQEEPSPPASLPPSSGHFHGHRVDVLDHASDTAAQYTEQAWQAVGVGFAAQLEGQFLYALTSAHAVVATSPMALLVAGAWVAGFATGIVSFHRTPPAAAQPTPPKAVPDQK